MTVGEIIGFDSKLELIQIINRKDVPDIKMKVYRIFIIICKTEMVTLLTHKVQTQACTLHKK